MTTFLERILAVKRQEVDALRTQRDAGWRRRLEQLPPCRDFAGALAAGDSLNVIAEVKQASPSKGQIAEAFDPVGTAQRYAAAGAAAISVLTDQTFFRGTLEDLKAVRASVSVPVLRKDFIIDEVQIEEARLAGADAVLLICAALTPQRLRELAAHARDLGLTALVEVHDEEEAEAAMAAAPAVIGINNRNLHTFEVSLATSERVLAQLPPDTLAVAESGIQGHDDAARMAAAGARAILVGESLMRVAHTPLLEQRLSALRVPLGAAVRGGAP